MKCDISQKTYLGLLLDIEETILTIDETVEELEKYCTSLGKKQNFEVPIKQNYESNESSYAGWITGFIVGGFVAIFKIALGVSQNNNGNIINKSIKFFGEFIFGAIFGAIIGLIFGLIVNAIAKSQKSKQLESIANAKYEEAIKEYNKRIEMDQERVSEENRQKLYIYEQIDILKNKRQNSVQISEKIYNYNIIPSEYWHNILALSYFTQYYNESLTNFSVENAKNSYETASLDFEKDLSRNILITVPKEIINASEYSLKKQRVLFKIVKNSYSNANSLSKDIIYESHSLNKNYDEIASHRYVNTIDKIENFYLTSIQMFLRKGEE